MTDWFNYGFNEDTWRQYCQRQVQMRLLHSMKGKIRVFESRGPPPPPHHHMRPQRPPPRFDPRMAPAMPPMR